MDGTNMSYRDTIRAQRREIAMLRAENKALRADAERYRYLCELNESDPEKFHEFPDACGWTKVEMDKLIDALRVEGD